MSKRVVVTGCGVVSPVGNDLASFWDALVSGRSGIAPITCFDTADFKVKIAAEVKDLDFSKYVELKEVKRTDRCILMALAAADEAVRDAGLSAENCDMDRVGVIICSGIGGLSTLETEHEKLRSRGPSRVSPFLIPYMIPDMPAGMVSMKYGFRGPNYGIVSACASGSHGIGDAMVNIQAGMMDACLVGGTEAAITPLAIAGFTSLTALSTRGSMPFDGTRDGFVMGEGAGIVMLESLEHALARGAHIYAELVGYGATGDAYHLTSPAPEGEGAARAMRMALKNAGIAPEAIDYINAHGTSTPMNDKNETAAMMTVFGDHAYNVNISSTKSMTGHLLGAAGGIEFVAMVMATKTDTIPPTINYTTPDPECPLNYTPNVKVERTVNYAMSNSLGFGGHNASLIVKKYEAA